MIKYVVLWASGITMFYAMQSTSPALGLLFLVFSITCPMLKLSLEVARSEDNRVREEEDT